MGVKNRGVVKLSLQNLSKGKIIHRFKGTKGNRSVSDKKMISI